MPAGWDTATLPVLTEPDFARWQERLGKRVVEHLGRFWTVPVTGFMQPVHLLAKLRPEEATQPARACWGFRARLADGEAGANGSIAVHVTPDLDGYGLDRLSRQRRKEIRRCLRRFDVVALRTPDLLLDQGYSIARQAGLRQPRLALADPAAFRLRAESQLGERLGMSLAVLDRGRLLAFSLCHAVDGVAYSDGTYVADEVADAHIPLTLFHLLNTIASRTPGVAEVMNGQHARENIGLCAFKATQGLVVAQLPARVWIAAPMAAGLQFLQRDKFYRLTGAAYQRKIAA